MRRWLYYFYLSVVLRTIAVIRDSRGNKLEHKIVVKHPVLYILQNKIKADIFAILLTRAVENAVVDCYVE